MKYFERILVDPYPDDPPVRQYARVIRVIIQLNINIHEGYQGWAIRDIGRVIRVIRESVSV